jgi:hypothetical protein
MPDAQPEARLAYKTGARLLAPTLLAPADVCPVSGHPNGHLADAPWTVAGL